MFAYQLRDGKTWVTQNTVTATVAEAIRGIMESRGRTGHYRLVDLEKVAPVKRAARSRKAPSKPTQVTTETTQTQTTGE